MDDRFQVISTGYIPTWRRARRAPEPLWVKVPLAVCSATSAVLVLLPSSDGYRVPLSVEWASGDTIGLVRLFGMGATLLILCGSLLSRRCYADAIGCLIPIAALVYLATSSPFSFSHFMVFAGLSLSAVAWQWLLIWRFEDSRLLISALLATVSMVICAIELGAGERFLIVSTLLGANLAFYSHAPEKSSGPKFY